LMNKSFTDQTQEQSLLFFLFWFAFILALSQALKRNK
jgi:hypothetical protein